MRGTDRRIIAASLALVVAVVSGVMPTTVYAGGAHHGGPKPRPMDCGVYPIAVKASAVSGRSTGSRIDDLTVGTPSGHEGWLTWTGENKEGTLARSLTPPGDSHTFVNPDDRSDRVLSVGDWVSGRPGAVSSRGVRDALDELIGKQIIVPVWDSVRGTGSHVAYHVSGFATVEITSYKLSHDNRISAKYKGPSECAIPSEGPVADSASATTPEDTPAIVTLTGSQDGSTSPLTFALGTPTAGSVSLLGQPDCRAAGSTTASASAQQRYASATKWGWRSWSGGFGSHRHDRKHSHHDHDGGGTGGVRCTVSAEYRPSADFFGSDSFTFTVSDGRSTSAPATVTITVTAVNDPPLPGADSGTTTQGEALTLATADLLANDTPGPANESEQHLALTAVSASAAAHGEVLLSGSAITYTPAPDFSGTASFTYTVCDDGVTNGQPDPLCADGAVTITVSPAANQPPTAAEGTAEVAEDSSVALALTGTDPDGDVLSFAVVGAPIHGVLTGTTPNLTYTPNADYFGPDSFTFSVSDGRAASAPATVAITVVEVNDPPVPGADSVSVAEGQPTLTIDALSLLANDIPGPSNESGQPLTITAVHAGSDAHGTVVIAEGQITFTPDPGFTNGTFGYTVCDAGTTAGAPDPLCSDTGTVTVTVGASNEPPVGDDQTVTVAEDATLPVVLTGSDPEGAPITFAIATQPPNGALSGTAPTVTYAPSPNFFGPDAFTFTVSDGQAASVPATVSITVTEVNDPPVAGGDSLAVPGRYPTTISSASLLANDSPGPANEATQTVTITSVNADADTHGTVTLAAGVVTYTPDLTFVGVASFGYTVCDNGTTAGSPDPQCSQGVISVAVEAASNEQPVADPGALDAREDTPTALALSATDADGDPLVFDVISTPTHGTLSGTAPDLMYTPAPDYFGPDQFTFTTSDALTASIPVVVTIDVHEVNDPPLAGSDVVVAIADQPLGLAAASLLANDQSGPPNEAGQALAVTAAEGGVATHGTVSVADGTLSYVPDPGFVGPATFAYTVCDNGTTESLADPLCAPGQVTVTVTQSNQPPTAEAGSATVAEDHSIPVTLVGSDPEGAPITYTIVTPPQHGALAGTAPQLTYTPEQDYFGPDELVFSTSDGLSTSAPATVTLTVTEVNDPPRLGADTYALGGGGTVPPPPPPPACGTPCGVIYGDPHLLTFDKAPYDAQAVGEFIAAKSTTDDFEIQSRFTAVPGSRIVSIDTALAMRVSGHRVTMYRTTTGIDVRLDGAPITVPATPRDLPGGGTIGTYGFDNLVIVVWPDGSVAIARAVGVYPEYYRFTLELGLADARLGHVVGLLGDADGNELNDLVTRAGQPVTYPGTPFAELYGTYVNSWRISNAESMFDYAAGEGTDDFTDLTFPDAPATPAGLPAGARAIATNTCNLFGLANQALLDACVVDVGVTGDADFANTVADAQEAGLGIPTNAGAAEFDTSTTITTATPGEVAVRTFPNNVVGQLATLRVTGNTFAGGVDISIRRPDGTTVASLTVAQPTGFRDVFTLPVTGTYTLVVDPRFEQTGSLTFVLGAVPVNTGTTAIGSATSVTTTVVGENATRTFEGTAGQMLTNTVSGNTFSAGVDVFVLHPNGSTVLGSLTVAQPTGFRDVFTLPVTGTYTLVVDPRFEQTGSLTFVLGAVPVNTGTTAIGTSTSVTTTVVGENATRTFSATAGQSVTIAVSGNTFSAGVDVFVLHPNGSTVLGSFTATQPTAFRNAFTLPVTGTYTLVVDPRFQQTGSLTFLIAESSGLAAGQSLSFAGPLAADPPIDPQTDSDVADGTRVSELVLEVAAAGSTLDALAAEVPQLTIPVSELLANDRPGPANESSQSMTVTDVSESPFTHGTVTFASGVITYVPDADFLGSASFVYTVCDDGTTNGQPDPLCSTVQVVVIVTANHPPVVTGQTVTTAEDAPVPITLTASDPEGDPVAFVVGAAGHGQVTGVAPTVTYTPAPDFNGADTFTYTANDGHDQSQPATVTVIVTEVNDPPVARPDSATSGSGQPTTVTFAKLLANDGPGPFDERNQTLTVTAVTPGADTHGTVQTSATALTYTPDAGFEGTAVIAYTVCDNGTTNGNPDGKCADSTVSIGQNQPPTANAQTAQTSRTAPVDLTLTASDPEDDALTFAIATQPQHGTLTGTPPTVRYKANAGFVGTDTFTFTASDAFSTSAPATVTITVNDVPAPTLTADSVTLQPGASVLIAVLANDAPGSGALDPTTMTIASAPTRGVAAVEATKIRYTAEAGQSGADTFSYSVCDTGGGCATAQVSVVISENHAPVAVADDYDVATGTTLNIAAPGVLANDSDPDTDDRIQARLVQGVTNGNLLLYGTGAFTYTPHGPGIDTFVYHLVDRAGLVSNDVTVTITVSGPPGPPVVGNNLYQVQQGRELTVAAPGVLDNDYSPNPRLALTVLLQRDAAKGTLVLRPDGSFVYTPVAGYTGIDQFSYVVRDAEGRVSQEGRVGITVTSGGPATATVGSTSPVDGTVVYGPTQFTATLLPPAGETVTSWTVAYRQPGGATLIPLASGTGTDVAANFDPTLVRNGTYSIVVRAVTSGGGVLVNETGLIVDGEYKPGRYTTTYRDVAVNSANVPIELLRTYDSTNKAGGDFGPGWTLEFGSFKVESNGPLGAGRWTTFTCGSFPFLATCYAPSKAHVVTVTWPDGHVDRFRFTPNQGSQLVPTITTAGFTAEPGTTSTLEPVGNGLLLSGGDFLLGDFFSSDGIYDPTQFVLTDKGGTKYRIDKRAGLLSITDRNGNAVSLGSDGLTASSGMSMTFVRDASNRITSIVAPLGKIDYQYSTAGDLIAVDYPDGTSQEFTYDDDHNVLTVSGGGQLVRTVHYDDEGRVTAITDGNGKTATVASDVVGHQQVSTDATGELTTVLTLDERGKVIRRDDTFDGRTVTTSSTYDALGRQLSSTDGNGHTSFKTYDADGNVLTETDGNGHTTRYTYNQFGQVLTITDPTSRVTTYTYDGRGNLLSEAAPGGASVTYGYDARGLLTSRTDAAGTTTYTNDTAGFMSSATLPDGEVVRQVVDPDTGLLISQTDGEGGTTTYHYNAAGLLIRIVDDDNHERSFGYDDFGRVVTYTDQSGRSSTRTYDGAGNMTQIVSRDGDVTTYEYDANNRLIGKSVPGMGTTTYTVDPLGRLTRAVNSTATLTFTYDDAGNMLTATSTLPSTSLTFTYDNANRRTSMTGPGGTTTYTYDDANRIISIGSPAGGAFGMQYNTRGLLATMTRPNGVADAWSYDGTAQITRIESRLGGNLLREIGYTYGGSGQRLTMTTAVGTTSYGYDDNSQLVSADHPAASGITDHTFGYDALGNRIAMSGVPAGSFAYDATNRLLRDATSDFVHDSDGRLLTRTVRANGDVTHYTFSSEDDLLAIDYPDGTGTTFRYDPLGRRVQVDDGGVVTRYAYDGRAIIASYTGDDDLVATFTRDGRDPTRTLEMTAGGARYFVLADGLGSTVALTDIDGDVVATYTYDAFGNAFHSGAVEIPFTFTGQLSHAKSGMLLFPARAYDPRLGRFISEDPLFALNLYVYAGNNPVNLVDPTGTNIEEYAKGGDAAWRDLVYRALVRGEANGVRVVAQGRTNYNLLSQYQSVSYQLRYLGQWL